MINVHDALTRTIALTLLHFLWEGVLIGVVAAAALRNGAGRPSHYRYLVCLCALLGCLLAPIITALVVLPGAESSAGTAATFLSRTVTPLASISTAQLSAHDSIHAGFLGSLDLMAVGVALWFLGAVSVAIYYAFQWVGVQQVRRSASPLRAPERLVSSAAKVLRRWRQTANVSVMLSSAVTSPIVIGLWRPLIIFPAATIARMSVADFEMILLHEAAHIVRRDAWVNMLQVVLEILLFYHPVVHWLSRRARLERECACDDFAVNASGSAYRYAQALTSLAIPRHAHNALSLGAASADLLPRLRNLAGECVDSEAFPRSPIQFLILLLLLLYALWSRLPSEQPWKAVSLRAPPVPSRATPASHPAAVITEASVDRTVTTGTGITPDETAALGKRTGARSEPRRAARVRERLAIGETDAADTYSALAHETAVRAAPLAESVALPPQPAPIPESALADVKQPTPQSPSTQQSAEPQPAPPAAQQPQPAGPLLTPVYTPGPEYPVRARLEGIEGHVLVVIHVGRNGRPTGLQFVEATPQGVFEGAVRRALMRWQYQVSNADAHTAELTEAYRLNFTLAGISATNAPVCGTATASRTCDVP